MDTATVDLFLSNRRLRAEIPMRGFKRLSDVLNNTPGHFLSGLLRGVGEVGVIDRPPLETEDRNLVVRLADVLFVQPLDEAQPPSSPGAERRDRIAQRMALELGDWRLKGSLHLVDRVRWVDYATAMNDCFLAVTQASITIPVVRTLLESPFLLVNGARLSALYEVE